VTVEAIKDAITELPHEDRQSLAAWLNDLKYDERDQPKESGFLEAGQFKIVIVRSRTLPGCWGEWCLAAQVPVRSFTVAVRPKSVTAPNRARQQADHFHVRSFAGKHYDSLLENIRVRASKQYARFEENPRRRL